MWILLACLFCFVFNIITHHQLFVSLLNPAILYLSYLNLPKSSNSPVLITLGLIPLLTFNPEDPLITLFLTLSLILLIFSKKIPSASKILLSFAFIVIVFTVLSGSKIISSSLVINNGATIFSNELIPLDINLHRSQLQLFSPLEALIYNKLTVYIPYLLANLFNFLNLKNLYDTLLLANLYPLFWGIYWYFKDFSKQDKIIIIWAIFALIVFAISKSFDKFSSLYLVSPAYLYLIFLGLSKIKIKIYILLFVLSLIILFIPKV